MVGMMCNPPSAGETSYDGYIEEKEAILESLQRRAERLVKAFNALDGITCNDAQGALYVFPQIHLPPAAVAAAEQAGKAADTFYCLEVRSTVCGVVVAGVVRTTLYCIFLPLESSYPDIPLPRPPFSLSHVGSCVLFTLASAHPARALLRSFSMLLESL